MAIGRSPPFRSASRSRRSRSRIGASIDHPGVDPRAVLRAAWRNLTTRGRREGASTIAMQVARMQAPERPRSLGEKLTEAGTALALVARHGHDAMLAHYLRLAPYGNGSHGIAHAARFYFDKPVEDLSLAEIALLAAVPQSPGRMKIIPRARPRARDRARASRARAFCATKARSTPRKRRSRAPAR